MVLVSSMGQEGGGPVDEGGSKALVADDGYRLASELGVEGPFEVLQAMAPHLTLRFEDVDAAVRAKAVLDALILDDRPTIVHRAGDTVTLTYRLGTDASTVVVNGQPRDPASLGFRTVAVSEYKAGRHMPNGLILCLGPSGAQPSLPDDPVDLIEIAPALLQALGVDLLPHHREPTIQFVTNDRRSVAPGAAPAVA